MTDRKCPDCGDRLSVDALRCACGWGAKKREQGQKFHDMRCTYTAGNERCRYPVGMFAEGNTSGWCIFHRRNLSQADGAEVVSQSGRIEYADAIQRIQEDAKRAPAVVDTAHEIALHHGNKPWKAGMEQILSNAIRGNDKEAA